MAECWNTARTRKQGLALLSAPRKTPFNAKNLYNAEEYENPKSWRAKGANCNFPSDFAGSNSIRVAR